MSKLLWTVYLASIAIIVLRAGQKMGWRRLFWDWGLIDGSFVLLMTLFPVFNTILAVCFIQAILEERKDQP